MLLCTLFPSVAATQTPCRAAGAAAAAGWRAYRADSLQVADASFRAALRSCPEDADAGVGLGFTSLHLGRVSTADSIFASLVRRHPGNTDAWEGRARTAARLDDTALAVRSGRRALALNHGNTDLRSLLDRLSPEWERPAARPPHRPDTLQLVARTRGERFEVRTPTGWRPFYIQGVNLGVALPGRYPSEFPRDSALYYGWIDTLASMGANTIRLYTILPPAFYRALRAWNGQPRHRDRVLWLMHGVWTELPPEDEFDAPDWEGTFQAEMRRVVDVVHGATTIPVRRGHAAGQYDADVSAWTLGYIIGREWEPYAVKGFDSRRGPGSYRGRYLSISRGPAMDLWLTKQCDYMLAYEADAYNALRPIAYTNWPTLDPLVHPTEASPSEEARWRQRAGRPSQSKKLEYENDGIALDANLVRPTEANPAGWFASYHAYPYYPDFMNLDPGYREARSAEGPSAYFGYLRALVSHHAGIPTIVAEYGVPSSRGMAHRQVQGWNHGGHDERAMAAIDARLTREIHASGAAGAIVFAWLDEWFKKNWIVIDYELPGDHTPRWHNMMDAEQNYGILGQYAGDGRTTPRLGGDPTRWRVLSPLQHGAGKGPAGLRTLRAGADESYLYLAVELTARAFPWGSEGLQLALDTHLPALGQHRLPRTGIQSDLGFEFLIDLAAPDSASIRVTPEYNRHTPSPDSRTGDDAGSFARRPVIAANRQDGRFDSLLVVTNRARFGRDGTFFRTQVHDRGRLRYATETASTLGDWYLDERAGLLELRVPWDLLNVTDPSSRTVLADRATTGDFGTAETAGFHVGVVAYRKDDGGGTATGALPDLDEGAWRADRFQVWRWPTWTEPRSHARLKPVYDSLRALWRPAAATGRPGRPAP